MKYQFTEKTLEKNLKNKLRRELILRTENYEWIMLCVFIISVYFYLRHSNSYLIFNYKILKKIFVPNSHNKIILDFCFSLIVSTIFYFLTIVIPYKIKKFENSLEIERRILEVYNTLGSILAFSIENITVDNFFKLLDENKIEEARNKLSNWEKVINIFSGKKLYEHIDQEKIKLISSIEKVLELNELIDYEIRNIMYNILASHLLIAVPYRENREIIASHKIDIFDVYDIGLNQKKIHEYLFKNNKALEIFLIEYWEKKDFKNYEKITLKKYLINPAFSNLYSLAKFALEIGDKKKYKKYLFMFFKSKIFLLQPIKIKISNFMQFEYENPNLYLDKEYINLRAFFLNISIEHRLTKDYPELMEILYA